MFLSEVVATTLSSKIIVDLQTIDIQSQNFAMFSVCFASFVFIMASCFCSMPISSTHSVIGALLGAGLACIGPDHLNWHEMRKILISWVVSPLLSASLSLLFMTLVSFSTINTKRTSYRSRLLWMQLIIASCFAIIGETMTKLLMSSAYKLRWRRLSALFIGGLLLCRLIFVIILT